MSSQSLPPADAQFLVDRGISHQVTAESGMLCLVISGYQLPPGFDRTEVDLLLRLNPGYPDVPPDMWWMSPGVRRRTGSTIQATDVEESHVGRRWQRWSRHLNQGQWRVGVDSLESFLALVQVELRREGAGTP